MATVSHLNGWDILAVVVYFTLVLAVGLYSMCRPNRGTVSGYFLAGRFMTWLPVGASLFASNIGSEHFIGLAGSGAAGGLGVGSFELNALIFLQLLGWVFLPVYIASGVHTLPEYMNMRFGGKRIRMYLAVLSLVLYIFTKISVNLYSGGLFIQEAMGWNIYVAVILVLAMTVICTLTGGLAAVIYTDTLQCFLMLTGATGLAIYSFMQVGGYSGLVEKYMLAIPANTTLPTNNTCGLPNKNAFTLLRGINDPEYPWLGFFLGQSPASIWYWAADQMMVQRALAAKSLSHAQGATIFAGYLKILPLFIIVMPGMISRVLYPEDIGCVSAEQCLEQCGNPKGCTNLAYPTLVLRLLPPGARGIMMAVMLAALMSDLTSIFNSASTLFTMDIYTHIRKKATARELLLVGRLFIIVMVVISILWVPIITQQQGGQLYLYIQAVAADLSPPIAAVYLLAILWKRTNESGAFIGLSYGFVLGFSRMILDFVYTAPDCGDEDTRPYVAQIHYMYFAMIIFWTVIPIVIVVSLLTKPPDPKQLIRTTYWTRFDRTIRVGDYQVPDEIEDKYEYELTAIEEVVGKTAMERPGPKSIPENNWKRKLLTGYNWFCGYEKESKEGKSEFIEHLKSITNLEQSTREKVILNLNLVLVLSVAIFIFTFFTLSNPIKTSDS